MAAQQITNLCDKALVELVKKGRNRCIVCQRLSILQSTGDPTKCNLHTGKLLENMANFLTMTG